MVSARGASGPVRDSDKAGGTTMATLAFYSGGRLEVGLDFTDASVVALPARIMAIIDVVLACVMGPPAARQAMELDALEDEVAEEEEEEATGRSGTEVLAPSARWEVLDRVRSAYLYFGRMDARFTIRVNNFALLLPQNAQDVRTNILMAQVRRRRSCWVGRQLLLTWERKNWACRAASTMGLVHAPVVGFLVGRS